MKNNMRDDEKQQLDAKLMHQGLDKILNTLRKSTVKHETEKIKPFKNVIFSPKYAENLILKTNQKS